MAEIAIVDDLEHDQGRGFAANPQDRRQEHVKDTFRHDREAVIADGRAAGRPVRQDTGTQQELKLMVLRMISIVFASLFCLATASLQAAGIQFVEVPADDAGRILNGAVWYPCAERPGEVKFGIVSFQAVKDCPLMGESLPLVVISHGVGGWFGGHHDTAEALADAGFVVAAINHPVDSGMSSDRSRAGDISVLTERPADMKRLVDFMLGAWPGASMIDAQRIGFFGFSRGGFTGLVAIGGNPDFRKMLARCPEYPGNHMCEQIRKDGDPQKPLPHDPRIRAAVLADPAFGSLFVPDGLRSVSIPVQLWASEYGGDGVLRDEVVAIERNLPSQLDNHVVSNAGHFAFLVPCNPELARAAPDICTDMAGFDRSAFHAHFNAAVVAFFSSRLASRQ